VLSNYRYPFHGVQIQNGLSAYEFDVFLPTLALALEYQGETHYFSSHTFGQASNRQRIDAIKQAFAKERGITLIPIPFWWDKSPASIAATIQFYRPDIQLEGITPAAAIPSEMPQQVKARVKYMPNAASDYKEQVNPTGW
jgi:hypothetical protein